MEDLVPVKRIDWAVYQAEQIEDEDIFEMTVEEFIEYF